ncbi:MAG: hypothetical protein ACRDQD_13855 [Nocardioidaceae bacterium]
MLTRRKDAYTVPYESDFQVALDRLRADVSRRGNYDWMWEADWVEPGQQRSRPATMAELLASEEVETTGTHSIIDCPRVVYDVASTAIAWASLEYFGTIVPVTGAELVAAVGTDLPTRQQLEVLDERIACARWVGRWTVLRSPTGSPDQLAFWGYSGD